MEKKLSDDELAEARVSFAEIADALARLPIRLNNHDWKTLSPAFVSRRVVEVVYQHLREPEYIPGEIYEDAKGRRMIRRNVPKDAWPWRVLSFAPGDEPTHGAEYYLEEFPERPLRRLVPEPDDGS
jgi:hypothetical protein